VSPVPQLRRLAAANDDRRCGVYTTLPLLRRDAGVSLRIPKIDPMHRGSMIDRMKTVKQFPTTQHAPKTREAAAVSLRAEFAELLS
jgi:hypothetical protein